MELQLLGVCLGPWSWSINESAADLSFSKWLAFAYLSGPGFEI